LDQYQKLSQISSKTTPWMIYCCLPKSAKSNFINFTTIDNKTVSLLKSDSFSLLPKQAPHFTIYSFVPFSIAGVGITDQ